MKLKDQIAVVTGGSRGIGYAVVRAFLKEGAEVVLCASRSETAERAVSQLKAELPEARVWGIWPSLEDPEQVRTAFDRIGAEHGRIDILVNNAGIIKRIPALEMTLPEWNEVIATDLTSPFLMSRAVAAGMIRRGHGKIVNMCSMMSEVGRSSVTAYAAAKGGLKMLTKNLATEWAKHNIQVNGIGPGYFATEQTAPIRVNGNPFNEFIVSRTPASRWGDPEDLAGAAVFLASRASDFVNGHILYVDGGILASLGRAANEN